MAVATSDAGGDFLRSRAAVASDGLYGLVFCLTPVTASSPGCLGLGTLRWAVELTISLYSLGNKGMHYCTDSACILALNPDRPASDHCVQLSMCCTPTWYHRWCEWTRTSNAA